MSTDSERKRALEDGDAMYYWNSPEEKVTKCRIERRVENDEGIETYLLRSGKRMRRTDLHESREDVPIPGPAPGGASIPPASAPGNAPTSASGSASGGLPALELSSDILDDGAAALVGEQSIAENHPMPASPANEDTECLLYAQRVAEWITGTTEEASKAGKSLAQWAQEAFPATIDFRQQVLQKVPWPAQGGYTSFLHIATRSKCKGVVHIAMLHFGEKGLHGKGMYVGDASLWLRHLTMPLNMKRLEIVPVQTPGGGPASGGSGGELGVFGYGADGAMINSTMLFALSALVLFAIDSGTDLPSEWKKHLQNIPAQYTRHDNSTARLVNSMVTSAVNHKVNRTMDDPLILAKELSRCELASGSQAGAIRHVVRLYKARTMASPALAMKRSTAEATIRLMDRT